MSENETFPDGMKNPLAFSDRTALEHDFSYIQASIQYPTITYLPFSEMQIEQLKCQAYGYSQLSRNRTLPPSVFQKLMEPYSTLLQPSQILHRLIESIPWKLKSNLALDPWAMSIAYIGSKVRGLILEQTKQNVFHKDAMMKELEIRDQQLLLRMQLDQIQICTIPQENICSRITFGLKPSLLLQMQKKVREEILSEIRPSATFPNFEPVKYLSIEQHNCVEVRPWDFDSCVNTSLHNEQSLPLRFILPFCLEWKKIQSSKIDYCRNLGESANFMHINLHLLAETSSMAFSESFGTFGSRDRILQKYSKRKYEKIITFFQKTSALLNALNLSQSAFYDSRNSSTFLSETKIMENTDSAHFFSSFLVSEPVTFQSCAFLRGKLKEYQLQGLAWLIALYKNGLNGILADETGMGKTIEAISLVAFLVARKQQLGPYLVIAPLSKISTWSMEFLKWAPFVKTRTCIGACTQVDEIFKQIDSRQFHVFLTTLDYLLQNPSLLPNVEWFYTIIDEGMYIKTFGSKYVPNLFWTFTSRFRLILTGTRWNDCLQELWSIVNFIFPNIFQPHVTLEEWIASISSNFNDQEPIVLNEMEKKMIIKRLNALLQPLYMRRLKNEVTFDLQVIEAKIIKTKLSAFQIKMYDQAYKFANFFAAHSQNETQCTRQLETVFAHMQKICNHPFVFENIKSSFVQNLYHNDAICQVSGKFEFIDGILPKLIALRKRVFIYFQMTEAMALMSNLLTYRSLQHLVMYEDSSVQDSEDYLKLLNSPDSPYNIFLLHVNKPISLIGAPNGAVVLLFDSYIFPQADNTPIFFCHKNLKILKLVSENSIEEELLHAAYENLHSTEPPLLDANRTCSHGLLEGANILNLILQSNQYSVQNIEANIANDDINEILANSLNDVLAFKQSDFNKFGTIHLDMKKKKKNNDCEHFAKVELPKFFKVEGNLQIFQYCCNGRAEDAFKTSKKISKIKLGKYWIRKCLEGMSENKGHTTENTV